MGKARADISHTGASGRLSFYLQHAPNKVNLFKQLSMNFSAETVQNIILAAIFLFFIAIAWMLAEFKGMKDEIREKLKINDETISMKMQAYERLTLFADRASLKNLVARTPTSGFTVLNYQLSLLEALRSEYDYNVTQQIYVSAEMWRAIGNLKEQNVFIINQLAATLPPDADAVNLSRRVLEYVSTDNADLSKVVLDALQNLPLPGAQGAVGGVLVGYHTKSWYS